MSPCVAYPATQTAIRCFHSSKSVSSARPGMQAAKLSSPARSSPAPRSSGNRRRVVGRTFSIWSPQLQRNQQKRGGMSSTAAAAASMGGSADPAAAVAAAQQQPPEQQPAVPLPPYYQLSLPVYSLATVGPGGTTPTMNLVTYASPISLKPRHYALGLYLNTLSWSNMLATRTGVLQLLGEQHAPLFELLGRTSGRDVDKLAALEDRGFSVSRRQKDGIPLLDDSCGWMELRFAAEPLSCGDHDVVICEVTDWHTPGAAAEAASSGSASSRGPPLYTGHLRQLGLLP